MEERLSQKVNSKKVNKIADFKKWLAEVKVIDKNICTDRKEFKCITKASHEGNHHTTNVLSEPSCRANSNPTFTSSASTTNLTRTPKLTDTECKLLLDNDGCLKCRCFFVVHRSSNCPNNFPDSSNYKTLTQADVDKVKHQQTSKPIAAVVVSSSIPSETVAALSLSPHPVAAVMGFSSAPVAYMLPNCSSVIGDGADSDGSVSLPSVLLKPPPSLDAPHVASVISSVDNVPASGGVAPLHLPHLIWHCSASGPLFPVTFD
jgi:hypothetical protein